MKLTMRQRNPFDITQLNITAWPPYYKTAFFNQPWVQEDLGVPLNYTASSEVIVGAFFSKTGDPMIHTLADIEDSLEAGVNVAMVYGDRDGRCPCELSWPRFTSTSLTVNRVWWRRRFSGAGIRRRRLLPIRWL